MDSIIFKYVFEREIFSVYPAKCTVAMNDPTYQQEIILKRKEEGGRTCGWWITIKIGVYVCDVKQENHMGSVLVCTHHKHDGMWSKKIHTFFFF